VQWLIVSMDVRQRAAGPDPAAFAGQNGVVGSLAANTHCEILASSDCFIGNRLQQKRSQLLAFFVIHALNVYLVLGLHEAVLDAATVF
jgi:hypothetical protein